ncbi:MAG: hypothetical protein M3Y57_05680 [Acidobacteriota bacterium]|nr:hypothetical protein [Acidobacteriota bacterium]
MDRRDFLRSGALTVAGAGLIRTSSARPQPRQFAIENDQLGWQFEVSNNRMRSRSLENRISGRRFELKVEDEFSLVFANGQRVEIPWWKFQLTNGGAVAPEREKGISLGFERQETKTDGWQNVRNLSGGQKGRTYDGFGWFRQEFALPEAARGKDLVFVLGGYDEQDWNEHWVYLNGQQIGYRTAAGRWRIPGRHAVRPTDAVYGSVQFGLESRNLLAVRTRGYDFHIQGLSQEALDQYVFRPFLFDQFVSVGEPYSRVSNFVLHDVNRDGPEKISFMLHNTEHQMSVTAHYELDGFLRRKWLEIHNESAEKRLLLDVELDDFRTPGHSQEGGHGKPVFLETEVFCAVEHPAGINQGTDGHIRLWHCPGRSIAPGEAVNTKSAVIAVASREQVLDQFHSYLQAQSPRRKKGRISIFTCFGINNQWGACSTLNDSEVLDCQQVLRGWQAKGAKLDFFTLDTGWPSNDGDLTEFANTCYPDGPGKMVEGIDRLGMRFGLWFSEAWGGWANGSYPAIQPSAIPEPGSSGEPPTTPPVGVYRNGLPANGGVGRQMCLSSGPYFRIFKNAILHHVQQNKVRLLKFDSGNYYCNSTAHEHLPGKYSTEAISDRMIDIVRAARAIAPDVFVMWYWGEGSPFWALHGDVISESGLFMEGSGTSQFPTLYYRDSVTLSLDQNTQFAKLIPPMNKDSLGVWLSQIRWANFMGKERWREALVMDLGRGSLVFPQLWGDPNLLNDQDVQFLAEIIALARDNEKFFLGTRRTFGDSWKNEPYGYAFCEGVRGFVFCHNVHFTSRQLRLPLGRELGLSAPSGSPLRITAHFPNRCELMGEDASPFRAGSNAEFWMRPFETLLLEIGSQAAGPLAQRNWNSGEAAQYGAPLSLNPCQPLPWMQLQFADAARFEHAGMHLLEQCFTARLPALTQGRHVLAITVKLKQGENDYRYSPVVTEIVQIRGRVGGRDIQMIPVPDARRYGNTQHAGCSWVLNKIPLASRHSEELLEFAMYAYLPDEVKAIPEAWIVKQWWQESSRPEADGFYGDAPS